jgi:hypothetical protein
METYVVRVWVPASAGDAGAGPEFGAELRGEVEHPRSGLRRRFTTLDDLADILRGDPDT